MEIFLLSLILSKTFKRLIHIKVYKHNYTLSKSPFQVYLVTIINKFPEVVKRVVIVTYFKIRQSLEGFKWVLSEWEKTGFQKIVTFMLHLVVKP